MQRDGPPTMKLSEIIHPREINFVFNRLQSKHADEVTEAYVALYEFTNEFSNSAPDIFSRDEIVTQLQQLKSYHKLLTGAIPENSQIFELIGYMTQYFVS